MKFITKFTFFIFFCLITNIPDAFAQYGGVQQSPAQRAVIGAMMAGVLLIAFFIIKGVFSLTKRATSSVAKKVIDKASTVMPERLHDNIYKIDSSYYAIAEQEVNSGNVDIGLWAKALVKAKGNEELRKVEYIKLKVKQLQNESK